MAEVAEEGALAVGSRTMRGAGGGVPCCLESRASASRLRTFTVKALIYTELAHAGRMDLLLVRVESILSSAL